MSPDFLGLYNDIYHGLVQLGYNTDVIVTRTIKGDPFLVSNKPPNKITQEALYCELKNYWETIYLSGKYSFCYDYLLAIDGTCLHPFLFELLVKNNPYIKKINYLFDGIETVYRFDRSFQFFDKVYSFDISDSRKFGLIHLPIYWVKNDWAGAFERDIFAFGSYNKTRSAVFSYIRESVSFSNITSYIKLYYPLPYGYLARFKFLVKSLTMLKELSMITHEALSTQDFREMINTSRIIVDTSNGYQDGLSARFMWALGLGRKIITNNKSVADYGFYSEEQIYIIGESRTSIKDFVISDFTMPDNTRRIVDQYRIDNWINTLFE